MYSMAFRAGGVRLVSRAIKQAEAPVVSLPAFLCPALVSGLLIQNSPSRGYQRRNLHAIPDQTSVASPDIPKLRHVSKNPGASLPVQCAGCGALSQTADNEGPGFYNLKRRTVKEYMGGRSVQQESDEERVIQKSLEIAAKLNPEIVQDLGLDVSGKMGMICTSSYHIN